MGERDAFLTAQMGGPWVARAAVRVVRLGERAAPDGAKEVGVLPLSACPSGRICT